MAMARQRFVLERELGKGGMGVVHAALDRERGRRIALKKLRPMEDADLARVVDSAAALTRIDHPHLVRVYGVFCAHGEWFVAMELVDGVDLRSYVRPRERVAQAPTVRLPPRRAGRWRSEISPALELARLRRAMLQVARGLRALHEAGWLHCDVKSSNVLVTPDERAALCDYDLLTRTGAQSIHEPRVMGTPAYMSPEQGAGSTLSPASDWYGFGVVLYELLTGVHPFRGREDEMMLEKQYSEPMPPSSLLDGVPRDLDGLCAELLRVRPAERPSGAEVLERLAL